ncbi:MAG: hypothetical protein ACRDS1_06210 [Pseudonocardiaceae bacterium]
MKRPRATGSRSGEQASLPPVVKGLLLDVIADGFVVHCCGDRTAPHALVASYEWNDCIDLVTIRDFDHVITARAPKPSTVDIFAPEVVVWSYQGPPQQALRALLDLMHPAHPDAPIVEYSAPPSLHIPRAQQRPMTIRLPTPSQAGVRAVRLAAAMATETRGPAAGYLRVDQDHVSGLRAAQRGS